jgi:hypothetical protein
VITLSKVNGITVELADEWANNFIIAYLVNMFGFSLFIIFLYV